MPNIIVIPPGQSPNPVTNNPPNPGIPTPNPSNPPTSAPNVTVNIDLNNAILSIVNSLNNTINGLIGGVNKIDDIIVTALNKSIDAMTKTNQNYHNIVLKALDQNIAIQEKTLKATLDGVMSPLVNNIYNIEKQALDFDKKAQLSLEALLNSLINSQTNQTTELKNKLDEVFSELATAIRETDYISEENIANWIKQAFEPLKIEWPKNFQQYDEQGNINPFNPFQIFQDAANYLVDRVRSVKGVFDKLEDGQYNDIDTMKSELFGSEVSGNIGESIFFLMLLVPLFKEFGQALFAKTFTELAFLARRKAEASRPSVNEYMLMLFRGEIDYEKYLDNMNELGFSEEHANQLSNISSAMPTLADLFEIYRRGEIDKEAFIDTLRKLGYVDIWNNHIQKLAFFQPPVQDVIRFAVRDVYDNELANLSRIFDGWDNPDFLRDAEKAGLKPEHAKFYWGAHWMLPSATQGFEMFQREKITRAELEALLRAADYAPAWREKLVSIAYLLPTKVDVRRAYEDDIIDDDKLKEYIRHGGTDPAWHDAIFEWHKARKIKLSVSKDKTKTLTISQIIKAYLNGAIQQSEAVQRLNSLGYTLEDAILLIKAYEQNELLKNSEEFTTKLRHEMRQMGIEGYRRRVISKNVARDLLMQSGISSSLADAMISLVDEQYEIDRKAELVGAIRKLYIGYEIDANKLYDTLKKAGFEHNEAEKHIQELVPLRELRYKELTRADIKKGVDIPELGIEWGKRQLRGLGYSEETIKDIMLIERWEDGQNSLNI